MLNKWDIIIEDRLKKISRLKEYSIIDDLNLNKRLPCVINIKPETLSSSDYKNQVIGIRHFDKNRNSKSTELIKVVPVPIHQDVAIDEINQLISNLNKVS